MSCSLNQPNFNESAIIIIIIKTVHLRHTPGRLTCEMKLSADVRNEGLWCSIVIEHNILRFQILGSSVKETKEPLAPMQSESLAPSWGTTPNKNT